MSSSNESEWFDGFFTGLMAEFWRAAIPPEATRAEADFLEKHLRLARDSRVLDVPCGHGRHSIELARRGYRATGVDSSSELLGAARETSEREGVSERTVWIERDMRDLPWEAEFDAAFCAGSSFGFFDDDGNRALLEAVARSLRPGGRFMLDSGWVAESVLARFHDRVEMEAGGIRFLAENRYEPGDGSVRSRFTASRGTDSMTRPARQRVYTCRQLLDALAAAGFEEFETFGSTEGEPFVLGSPRLLLCASRKRRIANRES
jgi:SAM-dependent methyltransferase